MREEQLQTFSNDEETKFSNSLPLTLGCTSGVLRPEGPIMRSVTIGHASDLNPSIRFPPQVGLLQRSETIDYEQEPQKVGTKAFSDIKISRTIGCKDTITLPEVHGTNWKVSNEALISVPDYFILEKTTRFIDGTTASEVAARISECLRSRSIEVSYHNTKPKAKCRNSQLVKFQIRLFSGNKEFSDGVIVELQRRSGSNASFMKDCRAILDASDGDYGSDSNRPNLCTVEDMASLKNVDIPQENDTLSKAVELILGDRLDGNVLGMEYLCTLTDLKKSSRKMVTKVSHDLVEKKLHAFEKIFHSVRTYYYEEDNLTTEAEFLSKLRNNALQVLLNLFDADSLLGLNLMRDMRNRPILIDDLVNVFSNEIKNAHYRPHDALIAAKCLASLVKISLDAKKKAREEGCISALIQAKDFGSKFHSSLEAESACCLHSLECH